MNDLIELDRYPYSGHSILMGKEEGGWQDREYILRYFDRAVGTALRRYREYVEKGIGAGRRPELTVGGLIRSVGGWKKASELAGSGDSVEGR